MVGCVTIAAYHILGYKVSLPLLWLLCYDRQAQYRVTKVILHSKRNPGDMRQDTLEIDAFLIL